MDNASDYGSEDSRFESWQVRSFYPLCYVFERAIALNLPVSRESAQMYTFSEPKKKKLLENPGIDPGTSHMLSERSTI